MVQNYCTMWKRCVQDDVHYHKHKLRSQAKESCCAAFKLIHVRDYSRTTLLIFSATWDKPEQAMSARPALIALSCSVFPSIAMLLSTDSLNMSNQCHSLCA